MGKVYRFARDVLTKLLILAFVVLLIIATIALGMNLNHVANSLAEIAYYSLVLAVIIQLVILIKEGEKGI